MKKNFKEKPKQKKVNNQNKLKKILYPPNAKPITHETSAGGNNTKLNKKRLNKPSQKIKNLPKSPTSRKIPKNKITNTNEMNKSQNNNTYLELDYLNFSKIDLGLRKLNSSFDEDIFGSNIFKDEKNKIVSNRYNGIESSSDTIRTETNNNNYIEESKENLLKTPSTLCNYYDKSEAASTTKKVENNENENNSNNKNELRKNLDKLYENNKNDNDINNDIKYINVNIKNQNKNIVNWRLKDSIKITKNKSSTMNLKEKEFSKTMNNNNSNSNTNNTNDNNKIELNKIIYDIKQGNPKNKHISKEKNDNINNEIVYKNNLMENYLNCRIKKRKNSYNMSSSKKNNYYNKMCSIPKDCVAKTLKYTNNSSTKSIHIQNNTTGMNTTNAKNKNNITNNTNNTNNTQTTQNINSLMNTNFNKTITGILMNTNNSNLSNTGMNIENKKTNNTTNGIYYNGNKKNNSTYKKPKHGGQQKPIILCYDQMKYDSYFVTPKNTNKVKKGKVQTSNKSTKIDSTSGGNAPCGSNTNNVNINRNNNYNILVNTLSKTKNKSFNKNKQNINLNNKLAKNIYTNNFINNNNNSEQQKSRINLKNHNKSSSLLIKPKGVVYKKNIEPNADLNNIIKILNSGGKENSQFLENLINKVNNSNAKSPLKKYKSSNALKISKTLTEQNILNRMQVTPKYYKIPKGGNAYSTFAKKNIYLSSNGKYATENVSNVKYNNSTMKKNNHQFMHSNNNYNDILSNLFNHKTQSDFKTNKYYILNNSNTNSNNNPKSNINTNKYINNNNDYGMDKHVKQKLLDRMNNATSSGWQYLIRGNNNNNNNKNNKNQKILIENLSEIMKSPEKKDFIDNNTIISNESEDEIENK